MIRYSLICAKEHGFESWFRDSSAFETLDETSAIVCPTCGSAKVRKALMAPAVQTSRRRPAPLPPAVPAPPADLRAPAPEAPRMVLVDERQRHLRDMLRALHADIVAKADNVGRDFATVARSIHEGEAEPRSIYGEASRSEVDALMEDGIPLLPMPTLPDDLN